MTNPCAATTAAVLWSHKENKRDTCNWATFPSTGRRVCRKRVGHKGPCVFRPDPEPGLITPAMVKRLRDALARATSGVTASGSRNPPGDSDDHRPTA